MAFFRTPTLLLLAWLVCTAPLGAQGLKQVIESLTNSGKNSGADSNSKQGAADQLPWVEERIQEAQKRQDLARSEGFQAKIQAAGFPESRSADIVREAGEALDSWTSGRNLLDWIVVRESVGVVDQTPPKVPANTAEALALERELDDLKNQLARFDVNLADYPAAVARAEQQSRSARHDLAELRLEADSPLAANARDRSDVQIFQATVAEDNANAQLFFQRWLGYRIQIESQSIRDQIASISKALGESGFARLLSPARASAEIARIEKNLPELDKEDQRISVDFDKAAAQLTESRSRLDAASASGSTPPPELQKQAQSALAEYTHHEFVRNAARARSFTMRQTMGLWNNVLALLQKTDRDALDKTRADLAVQQPTTRDLADRIARFLSEKQAESEKWRQDLRMPGLSQAQSASLRDQIQKNQVLIEKFLQVRDEVSSLLALQNRLLEEIEAEIAALDAQNRAAVALQQIGKHIAGVWNFTVLDQGDRALTLGTIVTAILAFIVSLAVARFTARRITATLGTRLNLPGSSAHLIEKLTLYSLSLAFVLMILQWLQIPLTIFAFLGGALAVGFGFGSQNLINNFISGLLLLVERQINVGDLVEVDGNFGRVTNLGSRCSSIRKFDGVEVLVPNSTLLEKNVINWTLSDPNHRFDFSVGVAYGSDVDLVMRTLQESIDAQPEILRDPAPEVAFENFGDSTLNFHIYYWLEVGTHSARDVGTHLRVLIVRLFKERGIEMAFPQRDIHLIPSKPIPVRLERES